MNALPRRLHDPWRSLSIALLACDILASLPTYAQEEQTRCPKAGEYWDEPFAVSHILARFPVQSPARLTPGIAKRAQLCLTLSAQGEVLDVQANCGDQVLVTEASNSLGHWKFTPPQSDSAEPTTITTHLTFEWRDGKAGLIWDFKDYPVTEAEAIRLVRAIPEVRRLLKKNRDLILDVDWYPEERDGVFYSLHLYFGSPEMGMTMTLGWYAVNAYSLEIWDEINDKLVNTRQTRKVQKSIARRSGFPHQAAAHYAAVKPWSTAIQSLATHPCGDRPLWHLVPSP